MVLLQLVLQGPTCWGPRGDRGRSFLCEAGGQAAVTVVLLVTCMKYLLYYVRQLMDV